MTQNTICSVNQVTEYSDEQLGLMWKHLGAKQLIVFHEQDIVSVADFLAMARSSSTVFFIVECSDRVAAIMWMNGWEGYAARVHYAFFPEFYGQAVEIARAAVEQIAQMKRIGGAPLVKTMIGLTPATNRLAVRMIEKVGFTRMCEIPHAVWLANEQQSVAGILSIKECNG